MFYSIKKIIPNNVKRNIKLFLRNCLESPQYYFSSRPSSTYKKYRHIIFVCKGNVCRSAYAEYALRKLVSEQNKSVIIESCGLEVNQGQYPPHEAVKVARDLNIDMVGHISKGLKECDITRADLILAMEYGQYKNLLNLCPEKEKNIKLLRNFSPFPYPLFCNIADPYGWGKNEFRKSFILIDRSLKTLTNMLL